MKNKTIANSNKKANSQKVVDFILEISNPKGYQFDTIVSKRHRF